MIAGNSANTQEEIDSHVQHQKGRIRSAITSILYAGDIYTIRIDAWNMPPFNWVNGTLIMVSTDCRVTYLHGNYVLWELGVT